MSLTQASRLSDSPMDSPVAASDAPEARGSSANDAPPKSHGPLCLADKQNRLAALREQASSCVRCQLSRSRKNVVFGEGYAGAPLVLVGEGPGETEDATGRPFVGRAGKLLDEALLENGLTRKHVYICNIVKCRAADLVDGRWRNRPPQQEEIGACTDWLDQQLKVLSPLVIVCLGSPSANALIHKGFKITQERGQWHESCRYAPWALAALHPAFILRQHGAPFEAARQSLVQDLGTAKRKVIEARRAVRAGAAQTALF